MSTQNSYRNIGIMAHIDAGKTTTSERILFYSGRSHRLGDVDAGNTQLDWMEQEQDRGITIQSATTTFIWKNHSVNLIDTPGHVDFTAEVERSLRVLDGAIAVFCAVGGVQPQSETVWRQANKYHVPRLIYINKMDRTGADGENVIEEIRARLQGNPVPIQIPIGKEAEFEGVIDLIHMQEIRFNENVQGRELFISPIADEHLETAKAARADMLDRLSSFCDEMTDLLLEEKEILPDLIQKTLRKATIQRKIQPVLYGSSLKNKGVQPLLDAVVNYLPAPDDLSDIQAIKHGKKDEPIEVKRSENGPLAALVFKIQQNKESGSLCYVRVYSGVLKVGAMLLNVGKKKKERPLRLMRMHAHTAEPINELKAGDIGAIIGLKITQTGDSLSTEQMPILMEPIQFPMPVISIAVEPKTAADMDRLKETFNFLKREDPTFDIKENPETGQMLISGMGELHLDVLCTRAANEFRAQFNLGKPQVSYRETITAKAQHIEIFDRNIAGKDHHAAITIEVTPLERGKGFEFKNQVSTASLPEECLEAIQRGLENAMQGGIVLGYTATDILITLLNAKYDEQSSSPLAFEACAAMAFDNACRKASPIVLQPIMAVDIDVPAEYVGDVISQLTQRGGVVSGMENHGANQIVKASAPLEKLFGYSTSLRSQTQGRGTFSMAFSHFD